jgi:hypothetical protein
VTGQVLPQLSGTEAALEGKDPFGRDLALQSGEKPTGAQKAGIAANSLAEALTPWLSNIRRMQEHGETAYGDSTAFAPRTKPGTSHGMSAANRVLNPFRPTYVGGGTTETEEVNVEPPQRISSGGRQTPQARREAMLERRAARLEALSARNSKREAMLERRAARPRWLTVD